MKDKKPPSLIKGRKGHMSVIDCLFKVLWVVDSRKGTEWPSKTFQELADEVSAMRGKRVTESSVRSIVYRRSSLFDKVKADGKVYWQLSKTGRNAG
jgi:hypothetical protein